jgi:hypothetical protein
VSVIISNPKSEKRSVDPTLKLLPIPILPPKTTKSDIHLQSSSEVSGYSLGCACGQQIVEQISTA